MASVFAERIRLARVARGSQESCVMILRVVLLAACAAFVSACGPKRVVGAYRDVENPQVRYQFGNDGTWSAESAVELAAGVFPHGAGRRLEGTFEQSGRAIEIICVSASRQEPTSGQYRAEEADPSQYNHRLEVDEDGLVPVGPDGERDAVFASDLNPFGARKLVPENNSQ